MEICKVNYNGKEIEYNLTRKKIKSINIRVKKDGMIYITCPNRVDINKVNKFLLSRMDWVENQLSKVSDVACDIEKIERPLGNVVYLYGKKYHLNIVPFKENKLYFYDDRLLLCIKEKYVENYDYINKKYEELLKKEFFEKFNEKLVKYQEKMKDVKEIPDDINLVVKKQKSRWGCCTPKKKEVILNLDLIKVPDECFEYVVVHELSHFKYLNHSKQFYNLVENYIPDWKERRKLLNSKYNVVL